MKPSIGRIVHYSLTADNVQEISRRRVQGAGHGSGWPAGAQAHVGNPVSIGDLVPMIICIIWPNEFGPDFEGVNGQAFLDGNDSLWITSVKEGTKPGTWRWPARVE
jgi:hypothetical protein